MKQKGIIILTLLIVDLIMFSCRRRDSWFQDTKNIILQQSELKADSTTYTFNKDSTFKKEHFFLAGHEFLMKGFNTGILRLETHYSQTGDFELRREICDNGVYGFEGIFYKDVAFGQSTWHFCNGKIQEQGIRFKGEEIGRWEKWNENGDLVGQIDHGHSEQIDSMPNIQSK